MAYSLARELIKNAPGHEREILAALGEKNAPPLYLNILLACLLRTESEAKAEVLWGIALDQDVDLAVRRTAAYAMREAGEQESRPDEMRQLLGEDDRQLTVFALQAAAAHMDKQVYERARELAAAGDVHVRVAAVNAIGATEYEDRGDYLKGLMAQEETSVHDKFSESSLVKRSALAALPDSDPDTYGLAAGMAQDESEDPGVRRRALIKCAQANPERAVVLASALLTAADPGDALLMKGCVEALLIADPRGAPATIQHRLESISDPAIRTLIAELANTMETTDETP